MSPLPYYLEDWDWPVATTRRQLRRAMMVRLIGVALSLSLIRWILS